MGAFDLINTAVELGRSKVRSTGGKFVSSLKKGVDHVLHGPLPNFEEPSTGNPPLDGSLLSFHDNFKVISGVPVFVIERGVTEGGSENSCHEVNCLNSCSEEQGEGVYVEETAAAIVNDEQTENREDGVQHMGTEIEGNLGMETSKTEHGEHDEFPPFHGLLSNNSHGPFMSLHLPGNRSGGHQGSSTRCTGKAPQDQLSRSKSRSEQQSISCSHFSHDGTRLVVGHSDGAVWVWDAGHGKKLAALENVHNGKIADCCFAFGKNNVVISIDWTGRCVFWYNCGDDNTEENIRAVELSENWECENMWYPKIQWPTFSGDGSRLLCPVKICRYQEGFWDSARRPEESTALFSSLVKGCLVLIFDTSALLNSPHPMARFWIPLPMQSSGSYDVAQSSFSPDQKGVMISCKDGWHRFLVLWPEYLNKPEESYKLDDMMGCWSPDNSRLVTWKVPIGELESDNEGTCTLWELAELTKTTDQDCVKLSHKHPRYIGQGSTVLREPDVGNICWCAFLSSDLLLTCTASRTVRIRVWDVRSVTPLHCLDTQVDGGATRLRDKEAFEDKWVQLIPIIGLSPLAISDEGHWLAFYSVQANKGRIWDAEIGVEFLRFSLPADLKADMAPAVDVMFTKTASKFLLAGFERILIWDPRALDGSSTRGVTMASLDDHFKCEVPQEHSKNYLFGQRSDTSDQQAVCHFSRDGDKVGLVHRFSKAMHIWDLASGQRYELAMQEREQIGQLGKFYDFAFSPTGDDVVTCMGDKTLLLWQLNSGEALLSSQSIGKLSSASTPCLAIGFTEDENGREFIVACEDQGCLVWLDTVNRTRDSREAGGNFMCRFSENGKKAVIMADNQTVAVWDLVERRLVHGPHHYSTAIGPSSAFPFPLNVSLTGDYSVVGLGIDQGFPQSFVLLRPNTTAEALRLEVGQVPKNLILSGENGEWVIVDKFYEVTPFYGQPYGRSNGNRVSHPVDRLRVIHRTGVKSSKELWGLNLNPSRAIAVSAEGRRVATLAKTNRLIVWTPYATEGCIPDYNYLLMDGVAPTQDDVKELLLKHGPSILNYPDHKGMSVVLHAIDAGNTTLLRWMLHWAVEHDVKVLLQMKFGSSEHWERQKIPRNGLLLALQRRSPNCVRVILKSLLRGVTTDKALSEIFHDSLVKLAKIYPFMFYRVVTSQRILRKLGQVTLHEASFQNHEFLVEADDQLWIPSDTLKDFWEKKQPQSVNVLKSKRISAVGKVIPFPDIAQLGKTGILSALLLTDVDHHLFQALPLRCVISYKWGTYGRKLVVEEMWHYGVLLLFFTIYCFLLGYQQSFMDSGDAFSGLLSEASIVFLFLSAIMAAMNLVREFQQLATYWSDARIKGFLYWASSHWNWIELISYFFLVIFIPIMHMTARDRDSSTHLSNIVAAEAIMVWWKMLYYAQAFEPTGPLVIMIREIVKDIRFFLFLGFAVLFGFGIAFFIVYRDELNDPSTEMSEELGNRFGNIGKSLLTMFGMMLGDFDLNILYMAPSPVISIGLFVLYMMGMMIILLNLLIAIMGDSFDKIKNAEKSQFLRARAQIIDDVESMLSRNRREKFRREIKRYLHVLVPSFRSRHLEQTEWQGRVLNLEKQFRKALKEGLRASRKMLRKVLQGQKRLRNEFAFIQKLRQSVETRGRMHSASRSSCRRT